MLFRGLLVKHLVRASGLRKSSAGDGHTLRVMGVLNRPNRR
jgi:hypothetical protein